MARQADAPLLALPVNDRDHIWGPADASVTLLEYGDFECPHCGQAHPVVKELQRLASDHMRFVFRHFPVTSSHPHSQHASEAAEAAAAQGAFWEMHDTLFEHQYALNDAHLLTYAGLIALDLVRFKRDMIDHRHSDRVREDFLSGARSGVNGTPTFFINGVRHNGSYDLPVLLAAIEDAADQAVPRRSSPSAHRRTHL